MNIITDAAALERGGSFKQEIGAWGFLKSTLSYNSGLIMDDKLALSGTVVRKTGDGYYTGTWTDAWAYYFGATYNLNDQHRFQFYALGAPQRHGQNLYRLNIASLDRKFAESLDDYNADISEIPECGRDCSGTGSSVSDEAAALLGDQQWQMYTEYTGKRHEENLINERENFFHKPQVALNHYFNINDKMNLISSAYWSGGMGGGTGTGAAPIVAQIARELGILTVAVVTKPFPFEGKKRMNIAEQGIAELSEYVDSLITVPNEKLLNIMNDDTPLLQAFSTVDDVLLGAVQGIADLIIRPGMINVDFADVRTVMSEMGMAMMGSGLAQGDNRAIEAAEAAVRSPLLEDIDISGAKGLLVNIAAGLDITLTEFSEVGSTVEDFASENATVVIGTVIDPAMGDEMRVTVVATGLGLDEDQKTAELQTELRKRLAGNGVPDYGVLDKPTVIRNKAAGEGKGDVKQQDLEYLDIPAFLRRQAD